MAKVERSNTINAPVGKVFSYITNPMNELEWLPSLTDVRDVTGQGVGQRWGWSYKMLGLPFKGKTEVIEYVSNERYVYKTSGGIVSTWAYSLKPEGNGTRLSLGVEYKIPVPVLGKVAERLVLRQNEREADFAVANIKARLESVTYQRD
jgi:carbon monoxide dehydrogenase subunit G